jgi:hypothetical protein
MSIAEEKKEESPVSIFELSWEDAYVPNILRYEEEKEKRKNGKKG